MPSLDKRLHTEQHNPLVDSLGRQIDYLRISITDRCNFRCVYCMPEEGFPATPKAEHLTFDEIVRVARVAVSLGMSKIRLTGGEPLLRNDIVDLVREISALPGLADLSCTTNGFLLGEKARALRDAGLHRVNVSLDTLRTDLFTSLARRGDLATVLEGIDAAERVGFAPLKINCVAMKGFNDDEFADLAGMSMDRDIHVRFIELMPMRWNLDEGPARIELGEGLLALRQAGGGMLDDLTMRKAFISASAIRARIERAFGTLEPAEVATNGPAQTYRIAGSKGTVGFISQITNDVCSRCNRLRLTHDGFLRPCLMSDGELDLRPALRAAGTASAQSSDGYIGQGTSDSSDIDQGIADLFRHVVLHKPARHYLAEGQRVTGRGMSQIGG